MWEQISLALVLSVITATLLWLFAFGPRNPNASPRSAGVCWGLVALFFVSAVSEMRSANVAFNRVRQLREEIAQQSVQPDRREDAAPG